MSIPQCASFIDVEYNYKFILTSSQQRLSPAPIACTITHTKWTISSGTSGDHSHRRHRDDRHRSHSRSSRPTAVQQPVSYSNPHSQLNYTVTAPRQQYSSSHRTDDFGGHTHPDVPQPHSASYAPATAKDSDPHSGGDFLRSNCTGRRKALCVSLVKCPNLLPRFPDRHLDWY